MALNIKTEPIRSKKTINAIGLYLRAKNVRDYAIFKTQLNTALRISDIVNLKYDDICNKYLNIVEKKTKKSKKILINRELKAVFDELINFYGLREGDYLFQSQKGQNKPITTTQVHRIYSNIAKIFNLSNFNSHSLRKTFCYFAYQETKDIGLIMRLLNHSSQSITLRYIGIDDNQIDELYNNFQI